MGAREGPGPCGALLLAAVAVALPSNDFAQSFLPAARALAARGGGGRPSRRLGAGNADFCQRVALRLMPTPAVEAYDKCFRGMMNPNSSSAHDWSVPGAQVAAQIKCWCQNNLTATIEGYQCCDHPDISPMCDVNCTPDCALPLAQTCIQECPSMCFESAEYIVGPELCKKCDWHKCVSVLSCLTDYAQVQVKNNTLAPTCDEVGFKTGSNLDNYRQCWKNAPKHTSHWNILSSLLYCICREGMDKKVTDNHCCDSVRYGGGVCKVGCLSENECVSQEAQTCIQDCQLTCPAHEVLPSQDCMDHCLAKGAPCRRYLPCRPSSLASYICDDGKWPEASSGCCISNDTKRIGCPKLCETQKVWRLDRQQGAPWWARWVPGTGMVAQCTCTGCPENRLASIEKLKKTVDESVWDNGQVMLIDIARRKGLQLGPNRQMQELMLRRNSEILSTTKQFGDSWEANMRVAAINDRYSVLITDAASSGDDPPMVTKLNDLGGTKDKVIVAVVAVLAVGIVISTSVAIWAVLRRRKAAANSPVIPFQEGREVVIGNPVDDQSAAVAAAPGAPVTVAAPTKARPSGEKAVDLG